MTTGDKKNKERPYWHVDAKWVFGILATILLSQTLFVFCFFELTKKEVAVPMMATVTASMFSPNGLDDPGDIEKMKAQIAATAGETFRPIPAIGVTVNKKDIEGKSPRELRIMIFTKVVEPIYTGELPESLLTNTEVVEKFKKDTALISGLSAKSHSSLGAAIAPMAILTLLFLGLSVFFSHRFGRFTTSAIIFIITSTIPALIFGILNLVTTDPKHGPPFADQLGRGKDGILAVLPEITGVFSRTYFYAFLFGLGLLFLALIFRIVKGDEKS